MKKCYVVTGAGGHLGSTIMKVLESLQLEAYGLVLYGEKYRDSDTAHYVEGDVRDISSLRALFENTKDREVYVIHTAGIIDISEKGSPAIYDVNVNGTKNMLALAREYGVKRFLYVSSVHAIPEKENYGVIGEVESFSPNEVVGVYAKTKALATQAVLDAGAQGLDVVVVHPSGIVGPDDTSGNHLVQLITDYLRGALPACVDGGYDFVDVRDVARGCLQALDKGKSGSCYILSNRHYEICEMLNMARMESCYDFVDVRDVARGCLQALDKGKSGSCYILSNRHYEICEMLNMARMESCGRKFVVLPIWAAKVFAPAIQWYAKAKKRRPLYTAYSLYTLKSNDRFSHDKATCELGYMPRDLRETIRDTVVWYRSLML